MSKARYHHALPLPLGFLPHACAPLALMIAVASAPVDAAPADEPTAVTWRAESVDVAAPPAALPAAMCRALERWAPWAESQGYRIFLDEAASVLLVTDRDGQALARQVELVEETVAAFEALLPAVAAAGDGETFLEAEWGVGEPVPDRDPVVLLQVGDAGHMATLLDHLGETSPRLVSWTERQKGHTGFVFDEGQASAFLHAPDDIEFGTVWRPQNELVNRLARLLMQRRFGHQPHWLRMGVAWNIELDLLGDIYAFPGRSEFIGVGDHAGWAPELRSAYKKGRKEPMSLIRLTSWDARHWNMAAAQRAWGLVRFLAQHRPESLSPLAEALRKEHKEVAREVLPNGSWRLHHERMVAHDRQQALLLEHAGEDVLAEASEAFRKGKGYRAPRRR